MKAKFTKFLSVLVAFVMSFSLLASQGVFAVESDGLTFSQNQVYQMDKRLPNGIPQTLEAWIKIPKSVTGRGGVILGNYEDTDTSYFTFEVYSNGNPYVSFSGTAGKGEYKFSSVDVRGDSWTHLAITFSGTTATCYVNGESKGTLEATTSTTWQFVNPLCIGSDLRPKNEHYFKGAIKQVAAYSNARTQNEIKSDMSALNTSDTNMILGYNLASGSKKFTDLSKNGYVLSAKWYEESEMTIPSNYDYSFMVIGDTQIVTRNYTSDLSKIYDYVLMNVESQKVQHVFGLGDITDSDNEREWKEAKKQIARMDGVVPYSIVRGNHDIYSSRLQTTNGKDSMLVSTFYDDIYGSKDSPYAEQYTYCYERPGEENFRARNTIHFFSTPILDYMVVALDYGAGDDILNWASEIIKQYPNHNVIVTTHGYLQADGTTLDRGESIYPSRDFGSSNSHGINNGNEMWDKFVSQHKNIVLLLCGHMSSDKIVMNQRKGVNGNMVTEMLIDPQAMDVGDPKGMVANFFVSNGGSEITVNYYSTVKNIYYLQENNYTFNVNVIPRKDPNVVIFNSNGGSGSMQKVETGLVKFAIPECTFTAPTKNHIFKGWSTSKNGALITDKNILLKGTTTLYAIWERVELPTYVISVVGGTCSITDGKCEVGSIVTAKADEPTDGKVFKGWHGANGLTFISGNASSTEITFEMPNNSLTLIAMFEEPQLATFKIHASVIGNGQISSKGYTIVDNGASKTYTITPAEGFKVKDVKVNGVSVGAVETYTFSSISQDYFIVAEFEKMTEGDSGNNTPDTPPTIDNNSSSGLPIGAIIGIIAGAVVVIGAVVVVIALKGKKK